MRALGWITPRLTRCGKQSAISTRGELIKAFEGGRRLASSDYQRSYITGNMIEQRKQMQGQGRMP